MSAQFGRVCSVDPDHALPLASTFAERAVMVVAVRADGLALVGAR